MFLLLACLLNATPAPTTAMIVGSRVKVSATKTDLIARGLDAQARTAGFDLVSANEISDKLRALGFADAAACGGKRKCLIELGRQLGVSRLLVVSVAEVRSDLSVSLELLDVETGKRHATASGVMAVSATDLDAAMQPVVTELARAAGVVPMSQAPLLSPPPEPPVTIAPLKDVEPSVGLGPKVEAPVAAKGPCVSCWLLGGLSVAAATAVVLLGVDGAGRGQALIGTPGTDGQRRSTLTVSGALALRDQANLEVAFAIGGGVLSAVLAALAAMLWGSSGP